MERERAWVKAEAKAKEKANIAIIYAEARERAREEAKARVRGEIMLFGGQHQRITSRSDPRRRPREQREIGHRLGLNQLKVGDVLGT